MVVGDDSSDNHDVCDDADYHGDDHGDDGDYHGDDHGDDGDGGDGGDGGDIVDGDDGRYNDDLLIMSIVVIVVKVA